MTRALGYEDALDLVASLEPRGWRLGLDRMERFVAACGLAHEIGPARKFVHIGGTNGKGSTTAYVQSILCAAGVRNGGFFSPYVVDPRERVQIDGNLIGKDEFAAIVSDLWPIAREVSDVTEFEFKTAVGFAAWARHRAEWIAMEVGLGGRFDATNVLTPAVSVITSIGLDHTAILGDTVEAIAFEKAGIIKPGRPCVMGKLPLGAASVIRREAATRGCEIWQLGKEIMMWPRDDGMTLETPNGRVVGLRPADFGAYSRDNAALAVAALVAANAEFVPEVYRRGVAEARIPGRFERRVYRGANVLLDGAHNPDSAKALIRRLGREWSDATLVINGVTGHDAEAFFRALGGRFRRALVPPIDSPRARDPEETASLLRAQGIDAETRPTVRDALDDAATQGPFVVTGSFYLVGEAIRALNAANA